MPDRILLNIFLFFIQRFRGGNLAGILHRQSIVRVEELLFRPAAVGEDPLVIFPLDADLRELRLGLCPDSLFLRQLREGGSLQIHQLFEGGVLLQAVKVFLLLCEFLPDPGENRRRCHIVQGWGEGDVVDPRAPRAQAVQLPIQLPLFRGLLLLLLHPRGKQALDRLPAEHQVARRGKPVGDNALCHHAVRHDGSLRVVIQFFQGLHAEEVPADEIHIFPRVDVRDREF